MDTIPWCSITIFFHQFVKFLHPVPWFQLTLMHKHACYRTWDTRSHINASQDTAQIIQHIDIIEFISRAHKIGNLSQCLKRRGIAADAHEQSTILSTAFVNKNIPLWNQGISSFSRPDIKHKDADMEVACTSGSIYLFTVQSYPGGYLTNNNSSLIAQLLSKSPSLLRSIRHLSTECRYRLQ